MSSNSTLAGQIIVYLGIPISISGVIGGQLTIIVFLSLETFRKNSCAFYLTIMSFVNVGELLMGFLPRIMISGFNIDWTQTSLFYCKTRWFIVQLCLLTTFTCLCLATIAQYCATCSCPSLRRYCTTKAAYRLCILFVFLWCLHGIPYLIYHNQILSPKTNTIVCTITNGIFQQYFVYSYVIILTSFLPIIITSVFGFLAYRNIQQIRFQTVPIVRRELEKQLTTMVLVQVIFNFFAITPNTILVLLTTETNILKNYLNSTPLSLALTITVCIYYLYFSSPFYIYICVSERFRRQLKHVLFDIYFTRWIQHITVVNDVIPYV